jgi:four helix bundle protein
MAGYSSFSQLPIWQEAEEFAADIYKFCEKGKLKTDYRMKDQLRAAASSISNNIAEGFEYDNNKDFLRFLLYAKGSCGEVFNQFCILFKADMVKEEDYQHFARRSRRLGKKIGGFIKYLRSYNPQSAIRNPQSS